VVTSRLQRLSVAVATVARVITRPATSESFYAPRRGANGGGAEQFRTIALVATR